MRTFESYPCWIVAVSNLLSVAIYLAGAYILYQLGVIWPVIYLIYIGWLEIRLMKKSCVYCYYFGKQCAFGKGKISSLLFKKESGRTPNRNKAGWKEIIPNLLVSAVPLIVGVVLLILKFNWLLLAVTVLLLLLTSLGNGFVRGLLACKFCKQKEDCVITKS